MLLFMENKQITVKICLGSSCHSNGSKDLVPILKELMERNPNMEVTGTLCNDDCANGPIMIVNGNKHTKVNPSNIYTILANYNIK